MSDDITSRHRAIEPNHVTPIATQSLHALLRIEETLVSILEGMRHLAMHLKAKTVEVSIPADEDKQPKGKRK